MDRNYKDILASLPSSWRELKLNQFRKLINITILEDNQAEGIWNGIDNSLKVLSELTGIEVEELELAPLSIINQLANKISFITKEPDAKSFKTSIRWKKLEEISYDNYVSFLTLTKTNPFDHMALLLSSFSFSKMTEEDIDNLDMEEVISAFFLLQKILTRYFNSSIRKTSFKLIMQMTFLALQTLSKKIRGNKRR